MREGERESTGSGYAAFIVEQNNFDAVKFGRIQTTGSVNIESRD